MVTVEGVSKAIEAPKTGSEIAMDKVHSFLAERRAEPHGLGEPELYALRDTSYIYQAKWREALALSVMPPRPRIRSRITAYVPTDAEEFVLKDIAEQQEVQNMALVPEQFSDPADTGRYTSFRMELSAMLTGLNRALQTDVRKEMSLARGGKKPRQQDVAIEVHKRTAYFLTFQSAAVEQEVQEKRIAEHGESDPAGFFPFLDGVLAQDFEGDESSSFRHAAIYQLWFHYKDRTSIEDIRLRSKGGPYSHLDNDGFRDQIQKHFPDYTPIDDPYRRPLSSRIRQEERNARRRVPGDSESPGLAAYNQIYDEWIVSREGIEDVEAARLAEAGVPQNLIRFATMRAIRDKLKGYAYGRKLPVSKLVESDFEGRNEGLPSEEILFDLPVGQMDTSTQQ